MALVGNLASHRRRGRPAPPSHLVPTLAVAPPDPSDQPASAPATRAGRRVPLALATWALIGLVLAVVIVLLVLKVTQGAATVAGGLTGPAVAPAPAGVVDAATHVPASAYDAVGAPIAPGPAPALVAGQPPATVGGQPAVVFVGAEFCPYCAAERWVLVTALSRFGTFSHLGATSSAANQVFPRSATFTFDGVAYTSRYVALAAVEAYADAPSSTAPAGVPKLHDPTPLETSMLRRYGAAGPSGPVLPFVDVGNRLVAVGASIGLSPGPLAGQSMEQIAGALSDPTAPTTIAILGAANEVDAAVCALTGQQPAAVCGAPGVRAGAARLGLG